MKVFVMLGYKPTFHKEKSEFPSVEVFIFDFQGDIYGEDVAVEWHTTIEK